RTGSCHVKFQRQLKDEVGVNLTPLIDVVFLLLIFFMVTTSFTRDTNLLINLPEASGEILEPLPSQIEILIARDGGYASNGVELVNSQIDTLKQNIEGIDGGTTDLPIYNTADANTTHQ